MNRWLAGLVIVVAALAVWLASSAQVTRLGQPATSRADARRPAAREASPPPVALSRNPFRYADEPVARAAPAAPARALPVDPEPAPSPTPEPIRLSGFVRRGSELRAVLSVGGTTQVIAAGETVEGFKVLSIDEDVGVRIRGRAGEELVLRPLSGR
jgi:hypothetical protein